MDGSTQNYLWSWINTTANTNAVTWQKSDSLLPTYVLPDGWVPTDPAIPMQIDTPPQKEGELVSLNVAPVTGKTPKQIAIELRALLKQMLQTAGAGGTPTPQVAMTQVKTAANYWKSADESIEAVQTQLSAITGDLEELSKIASLRKPSLIRSKKAEIEKKITLLTRQIDRERNRRTRAYNYMISATEKMSVPVAGGSGNLAALQKVYALVQGLPATEGAPQGKLESTIRAIEAILKAHHGVDVLGGFDKVPVPEGLPLVMMHYMPAPEMIAEQTPEPAPVAPVTFFSFLSASGSTIPLGVVEEAVRAKWGAWSFIHQNDKNYLLNKYGVLGGNTLWEGWNGGDCSLEVAFDVLRCVRGAYSDTTITLKTSPDEVTHYVAVAGLFIIQPEELATV